MMVMMMAITPSLKASSRPLLIRPPASNPVCAALYPPPRGVSTRGLRRGGRGWRSGRRGLLGCRAGVLILLGLSRLLLFFRILRLLFLRGFLPRLILERVAQ